MGPAAERFVALLSDREATPDQLAAAAAELEREQAAARALIEAATPVELPPGELV